VLALGGGTGGCDVQEQPHAVVQRLEGLPLRIGQVAEIAECGAQLRVLAEKRGLGLQKIRHRLGVCPVAGFGADQMDHRRTVAHIVTDLAHGVGVVAGLAKDLLPLDLAVGADQLPGQVLAKPRKGRAGVLEFARGAGDEDAVVVRHAVMPRVIRCRVRGDCLLAVECKAFVDSPPTSP
jgi:hypothetical protein